MSKKTLDNIFKIASQEKAERITISESKGDNNCRLDIPSEESIFFKLPKKLEFDFINNLRKVLKVAPQDLSRGKYCKIYSPDYKLNFRLNILPGPHGEKMVISLINDDLPLFSLNKLGLQSPEKKMFKKALARKGGLIVVASGSRQGRSTTLFSLLSELDKDKRSAYFMGLYPEFMLNGLISLQGSPDYWSKVLQLDSDIIAVDDDNPANLIEAIKLASTGRLVLVSINALNSLEALYKLLKLDLPFNLVLDHLILISAQSLANLKKPHILKDNYKRTQIGIFETLEPSKKLINFLKNNQANIDAKDLWKQALKISKKDDYRPLAIDTLLKKKDGII